MTKFREKAQGQVKQMVGEMIGDHQLVLEGQEQQHNAERAGDPSDQSRSKAWPEQKDQGNKAEP